LFRILAGFASNCRYNSDQLGPISTGCTGQLNSRRGVRLARLRTQLED